MPQTVDRIIDRALRLIGVLGQQQPSAPPQMMADARDTFRDLVDMWALKGALIPTRTVETFALDGLKHSFTWAEAGADWASVPPISIEAAHFNEGGGATFPVRQMDAAYWSEQFYRPAQSRPHGYWFEPGNPATIRFDRIPFDPSITFVSIKPLNSGQGLTDETGFPHGYDAALRFLLAEQLAGEYGIEIGPTLARNIRDARLAITTGYKKRSLLRVDEAITESRALWSIESGPGA